MCILYTAKISQEMPAKHHRLTTADQQQQQLNNYKHNKNM